MAKDRWCGCIKKAYCKHDMMKARQDEAKRIFEKLEHKELPNGKLKLNRICEDTHANWKLWEDEIAQLKKECGVKE